MEELPQLPILDPQFMAIGSSPSLVHEELKYVITEAIAGDARSLQKEIGISEIGTPCTRKLAYKLAEMDPVNVGGIPWRATVGRAVHSWLQEIFMLDNQRRGFTRWLTETRVSPGDIDGIPLHGNSDIYDRVTAAVIDWKIPGPTTMKDARKNGPKLVYRVQSHLYGLGYKRRGLPVDRVHVVFLPSAGELNDGVYWTEPYNEKIALDALARASAVRKLIGQLGTGPTAQLSATETDYCNYCEWFSPNEFDADGGKCPGSDAMVAERNRNAQKPPPKPW